MATQPGGGTMRCLRVNGEMWRRRESRGKGRRAGVGREKKDVRRSTVLLKPDDIPATTLKIQDCVW